MCVVVRRANGENIGFAIPPSIVKTFLGGDFDLIQAELLASPANAPQIRLAARLVDPLNKLRTVTLRYAPNPGGTAPSAIPDNRGNYAVLANSTSVP